MKLFPYMFLSKFTTYTNYEHYVSGEVIQHVHPEPQSYDLSYCLLCPNLPESYPITEHLIYKTLFYVIVYTSGKLTEITCSFGALGMYSISLTYTRVSIRQTKYHNILHTTRPLYNATIFNK